MYDVAGGLPVLLDDGARKYVWGASGLAFTIDKTSAAMQVYHTDGLGSVRAITDSTGNVTQTYQTDEFGVPTQNQGTSSQPFGFTGEQHDPEDYFVYLRARLYDPSLGRFVQRDVVPGALAFPSSLNRYTYVLNNPLANTDPSGRVDCRRLTFSCVIGIGAAVGAATSDLSYVLQHGGDFSNVTSARIQNGLTGAANGATATAAGLVTGGAATAIGLADGTISFSSGFVSGLISSVLSRDANAPIAQQVLSVGTSAVGGGYLGRLVSELIPGAAFRSVDFSIEVPSSGGIQVTGSFDMSPVAAAQEFWFDVSTAVVNGKINVTLSTAAKAAKNLVLR